MRTKGNREGSAALNRSIFNPQEYVLRLLWRVNRLDIVNVFVLLYSSKSICTIR